MDSNRKLGRDSSTGYTQLRTFHLPCTVSTHTGAQQLQNLNLQKAIASSKSAEDKSWDNELLRREFKSAMQLKQQAVQNIEKRILEIVQTVTRQLQYYYFDSIPTKLLRPLSADGPLTPAMMSSYVADLQQFRQNAKAELKALRGTGWVR